MGLYLQDGDLQESLASNAGWSAFGEWADSLNEHKYIDIVHLWEHGWTEPVSELKKQLAVAVKEEPPEDAQTAKTVSELLATLDKFDDDAAVVVSDGMGEPDAH